MSDKTVNAKADISPKSSLKQALYTKVFLYNIPSSDLHTNPAQNLDLQYSDSKKTPQANTYKIVDPGP